MIKQLFGQYALLGKYKSIVVSIALFLLLDASVLMFNFYMSFQIAEDALGVNLAGRQRMLSQRMVKSLFEIEKTLNDAPALLKNIEELRMVEAIFNSSLIAFERGGEVIDARGQKVILPAATSLGARQAIQAANEMWLDYRQLLVQLLNQKPSGDFTQALQLAMDYARKNNMQMLNLMNALTLELENTAAIKASRLRLIQTIGICLAIINFLIILFHFIGQLRQNDKALDAARKETQDILNTVNEGLFLLDKDLRIGTQHSARLEMMFFGKEGGNFIENRLFGEFLSNLIRPKDLETAQRFVSLLFRKNIKSNLIGDLNPLREIEVNIADSSGTYITKYMCFDFRRVVAAGDIQNILVTVSDITRQVLLSQELEMTRNQNSQQIEMLTGILHTDPYILKVFIKSAFRSFNRINDLFKSQEKTHQGMLRKLQGIYTEVHTFKGEAASLNLASFAGLAHELESAIGNLQGLTEVQGSDLLGPIVLLEKLICYTEGIQALAEKVANLASLAEPSTLAQAAANSRWKHLHHLSQTLAVRAGKQINLQMTGFNEIELNEEQVQFINDLCIQFIRNAIVHGIEMPQQRTILHKPQAGRIDLSLVRLADGGLELNIRDDGAGIDYEKIRNRAIYLGVAKADELRSWDNRKIASLLFKPGFSTVADATLDAGRGAGMGVIMSRIRRLKGSLKMSSRSGQTCQFVVKLPYVNSHKQSAAA